MRTAIRHSLVFALLSASLLATAAFAAPPEAGKPPALIPYKADFEVEMKPASSSQSAGSSQTVVVEVRNKGMAKGVQQLTVRIFFTGYPQALGSAIDAKQLPAPGPGMTQWEAFSFTVPGTKAPGSYWLCAHVSAGVAAHETELSNNTHCAPLQVTSALGAAAPREARPPRLKKLR